MPNQITPPNAGGRPRFVIRTLQTARVGEFSRSAPIHSMRLILLLVLMFIVRPVLGADKLQELIDKGPVVTRKVLDAELTRDDVPEKWRTKMEDQSSEKSILKRFSRGQDRILEVAWRKQDTTGKYAKVFTATIYDGSKRIGRIVGLSDGLTISQPKEARLSHEMFTTVKEDGKVRLTFYGDNGYHQTIEIKGKQTHLLDDLEYTKDCVTYQQLRGPLP